MRRAVWWETVKHGSARGWGWNSLALLDLWPFEEAKSLDSYQHRTLGTSRRHGLHLHTTPFHSTASEAPLSLPRRAILALWDSFSELPFLHFYILHFYTKIVFCMNFSFWEIHNNKYYNIIYNILYIIL